MSGWYAERDWSGYSDDPEDEQEDPETGTRTAPPTGMDTGQSRLYQVDARSLLPS
jgi:hypothetical protein